MSASQRIKEALFQTVYKKAARQAARIIVKTSPSPIEHLETISYKHMIGMLLPRMFNEVCKDWEWATGHDIPISLQEALDYYEKHVG